MSYIRVDNNVVTTAGMVHPNPRDDSWFEYDGPIPQGSKLLWDDELGAVVVDQEVEKEALKATAKRVRKEDLSGLVHTFADGSVIQTRPQDQQSLSSAIEMGQPLYWVMENDTTRLTSIHELREALNFGMRQASVVWADYTQSVRDLL